MKPYPSPDEIETLIFALKCLIIDLPEGSRADEEALLARLQGLQAMVPEKVTP